MGAIGGILRATSGPGQYSTVSSVKNQALGGSINSAIGQLPSYQANINNSLGTFTSNWNAATPTTRTQTNQEVGAIGQFYNGAMSNQLAQLRQQRQQATNAAADVAVQQALRAQDSSRLTGSGGLSSYNTRQAMAATTPIRVQAALDNANQARADLGYVTGNQLSLAGQREALTNAQAQRALVPAQAQGSLMEQQNRVLGGLANADEANTFYGLQKSPNMWADVADSLDQGILNAAAIYGSMGNPGMGKKHGGLIRGPGTGTSDSIPARLSTGEFVMPADVVHIPGVLPLLEKLRHTYHMHHIGKHQDALKVHLKNMKEGGRTDNAGVPAVGQGYRRGGMVSMNRYADGGLAGSAQQLGARVDADLATQWAQPAMIGGDMFGGGGSGGGGGGGGMNRSRFGGNGMQTTQSPFLNMSNWNDVPEQWKQYANEMADRYSNPNSPHFIAPGTYE